MANKITSYVLALQADPARAVLTLFLAMNGVLALYSSIAGLSEAVAFVRKSHDQLPKISGTFGAACTLVPARQQFGYFAPQVCSEFRLLVLLGDSSSGKRQEVSYNVGSEAELLLTALNASAQDQNPAQAIAAAYAANAFDNNPTYDYANVSVQAEVMPSLKVAARHKPTWLTTYSFFFKK